MTFAVCNQIGFFLNATAHAFLSSVLVYQFSFISYYQLVGGLTIQPTLSRLIQNRWLVICDKSLMAKICLQLANIH